MILDYNEYVTESGHKGVVNYVSIESRLPLFSHKSICPFCTQISKPLFIKNRKEITRSGYLDLLTSWKK